MIELAAERAAARAALLLRAECAAKETILPGSNGGWSRSEARQQHAEDVRKLARN